MFKIIIYRYPATDYYRLQDSKKIGKISDIKITLGKYWIGIDRSGIMGWTGKKNFYWIFSANKERAF